MNKILLICWDFVPYSPNAGSINRVVTLAEFLYQNNFQVHVLTSQGKKYNYFGYREIIDHFNVHLVQDDFKYTSNANNISIQKTLNSNSKKIKALVKSIIKDFIIPDISILGVNRYTNKAKEIIETYNINNVIISSPPHSKQVVGLKLKKEFGSIINLIVDYRDSWNTRYSFSKRNPISKSLSQKLERKVLNSCDYFTYASKPMLKKVQNLYKIDIEFKSHLMMNGFSPITSGNGEITTNSNQDEISIGYFGSVTDIKGTGKDMSFLLKCLEQNKQYLIEHNINFYFYGLANFKNHYIENYPMLSFKESLSYADALREMSKMDFLLIIYSTFQDSDEIVTGKLLDYIYARKPIICNGPEDMEAKRIIARYSLGENIIIDNISDFNSKITQLYHITQDFNNNLDISIFSRNKQYETLLSLLIE